MKLNQQQVIEIVGVSAVVISLAFVGLQLYLDRQVVIASQYSERSESMKSDIRMRLESESYMLYQTKLGEGSVRPEHWTEAQESLVESFNFTASEIVVFQADQQLYMYQFDNLYFQYKQGLLEPEDWIIYRNNLKTRMRNPIARAEFQSRYRTFASLVEIFPAIVEELDNE
ncbi:MAG: hypothetical protein GKR91_04970 [Pseudomonadales bacterium]|nr:hypothetical protein [Pseudomonadales bacterium]